MLTANTTSMLHKYEQSSRDHKVKANTGLLAYASSADEDADRLRYFSIANNYVGHGNGFHALLDLLEVAKPVVEVVDVSHHNLTRENVMALCSVFREAPNLQTIRMQHCGLLLQEVGQVLLTTLRLNRNIRHLRLESCGPHPNPNEIPARWAERIRRQTDENAARVAQT